MRALFDQHQMPTIYCSAREPLCVRLAAEDLKRDLLRVSGRSPALVWDAPAGEAQGVVLLATLGSAWLESYLSAQRIDASAIAGQREHYMLVPFAGGLAILGSDKRGTMWGVYECCRRYLKVDPLYLWTDHAPARQSDVWLPDSVVIDGPKAFRFRGWFINDEDLIAGFCRRGQPEEDYRFHKDYGEMLDMLIETALRLGQNLLIPCSHLDIMRPDEEDIVRRITRRGLYVSMHHQEPVGVHQLTIDRYAAEQGISGNVNYIDHAPLYHQIWKQYIHKWAQYEDVIWQLGLRGRGDRPMWYQNDRAPQTDQARGALISQAIEAQHRLIREECPGREILSTATLWMEGMPLYKAGALSFPRGTMVIQSDFGPDQMWGEGYEETPRYPGTDYGVYYHLAFWGCGPHLIQGNRPEKIRYNFRQALEKGDTAYVILNVSNFREFVYGIRYEAAITWDIRQDSVEADRQRWCRDEFEMEDTSALEEIYREYFQCFAAMDDRELPARMTFNDGMARRVALKMMQIIRGGELVAEDIQNKRLYAFESTDAFLAYYHAQTGAGLARFCALLERAQHALPQLPPSRRRFYEANVLAQAEIMAGLYAWVHALAGAGQRRRAGEGSAVPGLIAQAEEGLARAIAGRKQALFGPFEHWYDGDRLMNLEACRAMTAALAQDWAALAGGGH